MTAPLETPVLFLIFNRPDTTGRVFQQIRQMKPTQLYVAGDGPRADHPEDVPLCRKAREITSMVDWECTVHTLFREQNLGCKEAVSSAISWFFNQVPEGIILEDDCLPDPSFFAFCQRLLEKYRDDTRVMMIGGTNFLPMSSNIGDSYYFSRFFPVWGWASWRRAWQLYDIQMSLWPEHLSSDHLSGIFQEPWIVHYLESMYQDCYDGNVNTWDIQWSYTCMFENGLCIIPCHNLVSNIGYTGTHATGKKQKFNDLPTKPLNADNLKHPAFIVPDNTMDLHTFQLIIPHRMRIRYSKPMAVLRTFFGKW